MKYVVVVEFFRNIELQCLECYQKLTNIWGDHNLCCNIQIKINWVLVFLTSFGWLFVIGRRCQLILFWVWISELQKSTILRR